MDIPSLAAPSYAAAQKLIEAGSASAPSSSGFSDLVKDSGCRIRTVKNYK